MKIALINENSQAAKNEMICATLKKVVEPMGHEVFNYGMYSAEDAHQLPYVQNGILAAVLVTAGMLACNVGAAYLLYGREGLDCSILFAPLTLTEGYIPFNITCGALLGYQALLSLTGAVCTAGVGLVLSAACRTPMIAVVASAAVHIVPTLLPVAESSPLFRLLALLPVYQMQFEALMSLGQLEAGMPYAVLALPVSAGILAVGYALSRRIFAAHEVS